jgi:hypothetical protein
MSWNQWERLRNILRNEREISEPQDLRQNHDNPLTHA